MVANSIEVYSLIETERRTCFGIYGVPVYYIYFRIILIRYNFWKDSTLTTDKLLGFVEHRKQGYLFLYLINPVVLQRFFCITCPGFSGRDPLLSGFVAEKEKSFPHHIFTKYKYYKCTVIEKYRKNVFLTEKNAAEHN